MKARKALAICDINRRKLMDLYDSYSGFDGMAGDIKRVRGMEGSKSQSFMMPLICNGEKNARCDYIKNENLIRVTDGQKQDWFVIKEVNETHAGRQLYYTVQCEHVSGELATRNLYGYFDDENGIGTIQELAAKALAGTGWTLGLCDTFLESDGVTEKVRSYACDPKTGAYNMISGLCDLFGGYPDYDGDGCIVNIYARKNRKGMQEILYGKNSDKIVRKPSSADIITRLYVEGEYGDDGYVGIDSVHPNGFNFILNFDYYREQGVFTAAHEQALADYIEAKSGSTQAIMETMAEIVANETELAQTWGTMPFVLYTISNGAAEPVYFGNGAEDGSIDNDTVLAVVEADGAYTYPEDPADYYFWGSEKWAVKFGYACGGSLGAHEISVEAKEKTVETMREDNAKQEDIDKVIADANALRTETYALMLKAIDLVEANIVMEAEVATLQKNAETAEETFSAAMGGMLRDGYWSDENYVAGQEQSLYNDALEVSERMGRPQVEYTADWLDLRAVPGFEDEEFDLNWAVRIYDPELKINDFVFVTEMTEYFGAPEKNGLKFSTDENGLNTNTWESTMSRIREQAEIVEENKALFKRAEALSKDGLLYADRLDGEIDILKNKLLSSRSGWYTDDNGNIMMEAADGNSAMMLSGAGFMVANGKDDRGAWKWRTFGTGEGFTADQITAGILRAGIITILGSQQFYWNADNIYIIDPENESRQIRIGKYDGENYGIGYTTDNGVTWQNAIGFDGVTFSSSTIKELESKLIYQGTAAPENPEEGMLWLNTSDGKNELMRYTKVTDEDETETLKWVVVSDSELSDSTSVRLNELEAEIGNTRDDIDNKLNGYATNEALAELREEVDTELSVRDEEIAATFTTVRTEIIETANGLEQRVVNIEDHVVIEPGPKMTLGSTALPVRTVISSDGMKITDKSDQDLATFTSTGATVPRITIESQISLGNLMWVVHSNKTSSIMAN